MLLSQEIRRRREEMQRTLPMGRVADAGKRTPVGKRRRRREVVTAGAPKPNKDRLWVLDHDGGERHLVDTGADVSLEMASAYDRKHARHGAPLVAANGSEIKTYGVRTKTIRLGLRRLMWNFIVADVGFNVIGADFLVQHNLVVDLRHRRLVDAETLECIRADRHDATVDGAIGAHRVSIANVNARFSKILDEFPTITKPEVFSATPTHDVEHFVDTSGPPIRTQVRRLSPERLAIAKKEFEDMETLGIIQRSNSPWASPLHLAPKPGGGWRPCGDYRRLNCATKDDAYPIPTMRDFSANLAGKRVFSVVDLMRGYMQIPMSKEDVAKTAIVTPFGLWEFLRMPFGLKCAAQTFQRFMDRVTRGLRNIFVYLDDILVASENDDEHEEDLRALLQRLAEHGLIVKKAKCVFGVDAIDFLGHRVDRHGTRPLPEKVRALREMPTPKTAGELRRFLGMLNFYHAFCPHVAGICTPITDLLGGKKKQAALEWQDEHQVAFDGAKNALADAAMLVHPVPGAPLALTVDASLFAVDGALEQLVNGVWQPIGFFSRKLRLKPNERKYPAFDRELLGAHLATRHFRYFIEGRAFTLFTDQDSLIPAIRKKTEPHNSRQTTQLSNISEYTTDVRRIAGKDNVVADTLSRAPADDGPSLSPILDVPNVATTSSVAAIEGIDFDEIAREQLNDAETRAIRGDSATGLRLVDVPHNDLHLLCDESTGRLRPFVPATCRRRIYEVVHGLSHPGIQATKKLVAAKFVWPKIGTDVTRWARACARCQASKIHRHVKAPLATFAPVQRRFEHIHVDIVGPLPPSLGSTHLLTVVDRFSRWPEAFPVTETSTLTLARTLLHGWIARFGTPSSITSDRGSQFVSELWRHFSTLLGSELHPTTAYHPQANGLVERFHRDMKASLRARLDAAGDNWTDQLPWVLLGLRTVVKEDLKASSAELVYGEPLAVPGDFVAPSTDTDSSQLLERLRDEVQRLRPIPTSRHGRQPEHVPDNLKSADYVFVRHDGHKGPLQRPYRGPYRVLGRDDKTFRIDVGGREDTVSIDRLKRAYEDIAEPAVPARPPRRGRPPNAAPPQPPLPQHLGPTAIADPAPEPPVPPLDPVEYPPLVARGRDRRPRRFFEPETGKWVGAVKGGVVLSGGACVPIGVNRRRLGGL